MKIVKCGLLIDGTGSTPLKDVAVIVEKGRIIKRCPLNEIDVLALNERAQVIDAMDSFVMPGLIDSHVHLSFDASDNPAGTLLADSDEYLMIRQVRNAQTALKAGITMVRDCGSRGMSLLALRDAIDCSFMAGARIFASGIPVTSTGGHCYFLHGEADSDQELIKLVRRLSRDGADYIKVMLSGGNMTPGSNPQITQYTLEQMDGLVRTAHELGKTVAAHVLNTKSIRIAVDAGVDTLEHCAFLSPGGASDFDPTVVEKAIDKELYISPAMNYGTISGYIPAPGESVDDPKVQNKIEFWRRLSETRFSTTREMVHMGAKIIAGTDAGTKRTSFEDYWKTLKVMNEQCDMTSMQVIESATRLPACAMGIDKFMGTVEEGKKADLLILKKNPLLDMKNLTEIAGVMLDGNMVAR